MFTIVPTSLKSDAILHQYFLGSYTHGFLIIIFCYTNELETWDWCHNVRLVETHRLTCIMTYFNDTVALTWHDLRSNFKIEDKSIWINPAWREDHEKSCQNYYPSVSS